jgi:hypothetical protein
MQYSKASAQSAWIEKNPQDAPSQNSDKAINTKAATTQWFLSIETDQANESVCTLKGALAVEFALPVAREEPLAPEGAVGATSMELAEPASLGAAVPVDADGLFWEEPVTVGAATGTDDESRAVALVADGSVETVEGTRDAALVAGTLLDEATAEDVAIDDETEESLAVADVEEAIEEELDTALELELSAADDAADELELACPPPSPSPPPSFTTIPTPAAGSTNPLSV